jgi:hypothetical protein
MYDRQQDCVVMMTRYNKADMVPHGVLTTYQQPAPATCCAVQVFLSNTETLPHQREQLPLQNPSSETAGLWR